MKAPKRKSQGAHGLRIDLMNIWWHLREVMEALASAQLRAAELGMVDQLAVATKALRAIANTATTDKRSKGVAKAALEKMKVTP